MKDGVCERERKRERGGRKGRVRVRDKLRE